MFRTSNLLDRVSILRQQFFEYNNFLKRFNYLRYINRQFDNSKLKAASSRVDKPFMFEPFRKIISKRLNRPVNIDLNLSVQEVYDQTKESLRPYSFSDFSWKKINLDTLLMSAIITWDELGFDTYYGSVFTQPKDCPFSFPQSTSAGYPNYGRKDQPLNRSDAISWLENFFSNPSYSKVFNNPITFFRRYKTKLADDLLSSKTKVRLIWGYPFRISCLEAFFFRKMVDAHVRRASSPNVSYLSAGKRRCEIADRVIKPSRRFRSDVASVDISNFDASVKSYFDALFFALFYLSNKDQFTNDLERCFKILLAYTCYTPYVYKSDYSSCKLRGIASGSLQTSAKGTFISRCCSNYLFLEKSKNVRSANDEVVNMGDDINIVLKNVTFDEFVEVFSRFGFKINKSKTSIAHFDGVIEFAGFKWRYPDNAPYQELTWYISHLCIPSRYYRDIPFPVSVLQTYRAISLCGGLLDGIKMFEYLIGDDDFVWVDLKKQISLGLKPKIAFVTRDEGKLFQPVPLDTILREGWRAF